MDNMIGESVESTVEMCERGEENYRMEKAREGELS